MSFSPGVPNPDIDNRGKYSKDISHISTLILLDIGFWLESFPPAAHATEQSSARGASASIDWFNNVEGIKHTDTTCLPINITAASCETPPNSSVPNTNARDQMSRSQHSFRSETIPCQCTKMQSSNICALRTIEQRQSPVKFDTILTCTRVVCAAAERHIACATCRRDPNPVPTLHLTFMTFQLIFRWAHAQVHHPDLPCPEHHAGNGMRLGIYEISRDESVALRQTLVATALEKMQRALVNLSEWVEAINGEVEGRGALEDTERGYGWESEKHELQNLRVLSQSLLQTSNTLAKRMEAKQHPRS